MDWGRFYRFGSALLIVGVMLGMTLPAGAQELRVRSDGRTLAITALSDAIIRVRMTTGETLPEDASWAVPADVRAQRAVATISGSRLSTALLTVDVDPVTLAISVRDVQGRVIVTDDAEPWRREGGGFAVRKQLDVSEHIFGMGDKSGTLDRRGRAFTNWNTDFYNFRSSDDPLYKSIPFYISSGADGGGGAYGLLLDNSWRSWFDFGAREEDVLAFGAVAGPVDYYVIAGPSIAEVVRRYTDLTGRASMPPRWALGYQQSRWSYMSEDEVRTLADRLRAERIPTDVIWLDIDFQDRNRPFTVDRRTFPHFEDMVSDLLGQGITTVAIADLHVAHAPDEGYVAYDSGAAGDHFLQRADGTAYVGPVWPGPAVFPEFTRPQSRDWWGEQLRHLVSSGVGGIWNDMNEPAIFESPTKTMPADVRHRIEGDGFAARVATHGEIHNVYGMLNTRATYDGLLRLQPGERPFVMTRATFAGGQRYAVTWTGDNSSTWDHLRLSVQQMLSLGLSGFAWNGADVGGFTGGPPPELLTRWFQYATFAPIFRDHSQKDVARAEPWVHGEEHLAMRRAAVEQRYRLMPYFYAVAAATERDGDPFARPLFYDWPEALAFPCDASMQYSVGGRLLVAGAPKPEQLVDYQVCLPAGDWFDLATGARVEAVVGEGARHSMVTITPRLDSLPVYVRAGTILPMQPLVQSTRERPQGPIELHIYPGAGCSGELYDDDGHSLAYRRGTMLRQQLRCTMRDGRLESLSFAPREGTHPAWWTEMRVIVHGGGRYRARLGRRLLAVQHDGGSSSFVIPDQPRAATINFSPEE